MGQGQSRAQQPIKNKFIKGIVAQAGTPKESLPIKTQVMQVSNTETFCNSNYNMINYFLIIIIILLLLYIVHLNSKNNLNMV